MCVSSSWLLEQGQPHHSPEQPRLVHVVITLGFTLGELGQRYAENSQVCQREAPQTWLLHKHELQQGRIPIETKKKNGIWGRKTLIPVVWRAVPSCCLDLDPLE